MTGREHFSSVSRLRQRFDRFARDNRGAAAVEFALIAAPFFFLLFGLLEICLIFIMSAILDHAVTEASRPLRTGEVQNAALDAAAFRTGLCERFMGLMDCDQRLHIDVSTIGGFSNSPTGLPLSGNGDVDDSGFGFNPGGPSEIVAVRVFYEWELMAPIISMPLRNMSGNKHLLQASAVFRNEPFGS